uniref:Endonuclease-reverse transcriptase n=1 Tax=Trichobilharzia regenti TaxID=157069 RepID=A0AA85JMG2_TRIRE|nr:unnamed protein product [Trichobilharzia regenti]
MSRLHEHLVSCISTNGLIGDEISAWIRKARAAFADLHHLWRRRDIRLSTKGRMYCSAVRSVLLYGSETWPIRVEDMKRLTAFDHRCLRSLSHVRWFNKVSNVDVRRRVLGKEGKSIDEAIKLHRLRWVGHVLHMPNHRLTRRALLADIGAGWKRASGGQTKNMASIHEILDS